MKNIILIILSFCGFSVYADIVWSGEMDLQLGYTSIPCIYELDFNDDGVIDLLVNHSRGLQITPTNGCALVNHGEILAQQDFYGDYQTGVVIDSSLAWTTDQERLVYYSHSDAYGDYYAGLWMLARKGTLGFSFEENGQTHYGWLRMSNQYRESVILHDFAYESLPNQGIVAGFPPLDSSNPYISSEPKNYLISSPFSLPVDLDLNEDGITDISFSSTRMVSGDFPVSEGYESVSINTLGNYVFSNGEYALPFSTFTSISDPIAPEGAWSKGSHLISSFTQDYTQGTHTDWSGPWSEFDVGYLSVLFKDSSNQLHPASIRLLVLDGSPMSIYVMDWTYGIDPLPEPESEGTAVLSSGDELQMSFSVRNGLQYTLEHCTNLVEGVWSTNSIFSATSDSLSVTNSITTDSGYWRLKQIP